MNSRGNLSIEKFLSLENTLTNADHSETSGNYDFMP